MRRKGAGDVFPAPAGINRTLTQRANILTGVPRASGDKPEAYISNRIGLRVFPAPAGINRGKYKFQRAS
ncbi:hypothetical protein G9U74_002159 [Escherichia coli]|nr:hypothetical protein [Escherichia coli]EFC3457413.1 hypothetical protein [Escherichia coli]EFD1994899.1 hypothetical protein [Escherichia coli]EFM6067382.1 hypothetical protein [Escherichia coli]EHI0503886.1 hypothetical protein [Escherichia coli]